MANNTEDICNRCNSSPPLNLVINGDYSYCKTCLIELREEELQEELYFIEKRERETINDLKEAKKSINTAIYFKFNKVKEGDHRFFCKGNYSRN